jgi:zinc D-Ala-D-Ala carboxypeptidase
MRYFNYHEFDSPDAIGSGEQMMDEVFVQMLDKARHLAGIPFKINSGYRTPERNRLVGGKKDSAHLKGLAADIHCVDSRSRGYILGALLEVGFNRIGIAKTFIHVDDDPSKDADVVWLYP